MSAKPGFLNENSGRAYPLIYVATQEWPTYGLVNFGSTVLTGSFRSALNELWLDWARSIGAPGSARIELCVKSDADDLSGRSLLFGFEESDGDYVTVFARDQANVDESDLANTAAFEPADPDATPENCSDVAIWTGFVTVGRVSRLVTWLREHSAPSGMNISVFNPSTKPVFEPGCVLAPVRSGRLFLGVVNADRVRTPSAPGCRPPCYDHELAEFYVVEDCLQGDIRFEAGHNMLVRQRDAVNTLSFSAVVGAGKGEPQTELALFSGEQPPQGRTLLSGGDNCCEVVRSVNGVGGPNFRIEAGPGVEITEIPEQHRVIINVSLIGLALCPDLPENVPVPCEYPDPDECICGPEDPDNFECPEGSTYTTAPPTTTPEP